MSWRRILFLTACMLTVIVGATWFVLQRTGAATGIVRSVISNLLATDFQLESAQVDLFGGNLTLEEFAVDDPLRPGSKLIEAKTLQLDVEPGAIGSALAIHEVVADGLVLDIDLTEGRAPNIAQLLQQQLPQSESSSLDVVIPARVTRARARLRIDSEAPALEFSDVDLALTIAMLDDGTANRQRGVLHGSARFDNLDVEVELLGDLDLEGGMCRLQARIADLVVDAPFLRRLLPLLRTELGADIALGHLHHLTLHLDLPLTPDEEIVAGAAFEFSEVHCSLPELPLPLRGASVRGVVSTRDGGTGQFTAEQLLPAGTTELVAKVSNFLGQPRLELRGTGRNIALDQTVETALRSFPIGDKIVDALRPRAGEADFDLYLSQPGTADSIIDLDLHLRGAQIAYHGFPGPGRRVAFPLPIVNANGRVHLRDRHVSLEDFHAELSPEAGGGELSMSGHVAAGNNQTRVSLDLFAPRLQCTPALRSAFSELIGDDGSLYDQFSPKGAAAVRLQLRPDHELGSTWQVDVDPLDAEVTWSRFPLPIPGVNGKITARAEGVEMDLRTGEGDYEASLRGRLMATPAQGNDIVAGRIDVAIEASRLPLNTALRRASTALAPELARVWDELQPTGATDMRLNVQRANGDAELVYDLEFDLIDAKSTPRSFPMPITQINGEVLVHGRGDAVSIVIDAARGRLQEASQGSGELAIVGTVEIDDGYREDITAVLRDLDLTPSFGAILETSGAVEPGTWDILRPSGRVDIISRQQRIDDGEPATHYTVLLRDARSDAEMLPHPATDVSGELEIINGELSFRDLRARLASANVTCSKGRVGPAENSDRTEVSFVVSSEDFPVDDSFARLFVGPVRQAILDRQLKGKINVNGLSLKFLLPAKGADDTPVEVVIAGDSIEAIDVEMLLGTRLHNINGVVTIDESHITQDGGALMGSVTRGWLTLLGHPIVDLQTRFIADAERFRLRDLSFNLHGGRVSGRDLAPSAAADANTEPATSDGDLVYVLPESEDAQGTLAAHLEFEGMSLRDFLQQSGMEGSPYHGTIRGWVRVDELAGYDYVDMRGAAGIEILDGDLGTVPLFTAIYAQMAERNRPRFESVSANLEIQDRTVQISNLNLKSPLVTVNGGGSLTMEGYLDVQVTTDSLLGGSADLLLLPQVVQILTSRLVRIHLFGHLRDLNAQQRWFTQDDPRRQRLLPIPPRLEKPQRPGF